MASKAQTHITTFWDTVAPQYEAHPGNVRVVGTAEYGQWVETFRRVVPDNTREVLDVATGTGFVALILAGLGHHVTGVDLSPRMLVEARAAAQDHGVPIRFQLGDAVAPAFPDASFDVITCRHLLWTLREAETAVRNWRRLLRTGGRVVAVDGFWSAPPDDSGSEGSQSDRPPLFDDHYSAETQSAIPLWGATGLEPVVQLFQDAGFGRVDAVYVPELADPANGGDPPYLLVAS